MRPERCGRPCWVERSGSSIEYLEGLHAFFPEARFLHIHRDGPEAALSMRGVVEVCHYDTGMGDLSHETILKAEAKGREEKAA